MVNLYAFESHDLYAKTDIISECDNYVQSHFDNLLIAEQDIQNYNNYYLGNGIKVILPEETYIYYVYPVILSEKIVATIHVTDIDDGYAATYTKSLAKELEELKTQTSKDVPLVLIRQGTYFYAKIGDNQILLENHRENDLVTKSNTTLENLPIVDYSNLSTRNIYDTLIQSKASVKKCLEDQLKNYHGLYMKHKEMNRGVPLLQQPILLEILQIGL